MSRGMKAGGLGFIAILALLSSLGPFSIDMYLPAMPQMAGALSASPAAMQMTITAYLIGNAVGPLFLSPLSDSWGRKRAQTLFLLGYAGASLACALAPNAEALIAARVCQAVAAGASTAAARAMLSDLFSGDALSRATSVLMTIFTIGPVAAPLIGAGILEVAGWRWIFWLLVGVGLVSILLFQVLPETLPPEKRRPYAPGAVLSGYLAMMRNPRALRYFASTFAFAFVFFGMLASAPFIFIEHFGMSPSGFAWLFAAISCAAFAGNIVNARFVFRFGYERMLRGATWAQAALGLAMTAVALTGAGGLWGVFAVMLWLMGVFHVSLANTMAGLMSVAGDRAGAAGAAMIFWRFVGGAAGSLTVGAFGTSAPWPFAAVILIGAAGALLALKVGRGAAPDAR